jgi:hypothetical protein
VKKKRRRVNEKNPKLFSEAWCFNHQNKLFFEGGVSKRRIAVPLPELELSIHLFIAL